MILGQCGPSCILSWKTCCKTMVSPMSFNRLNQFIKVCLTFCIIVQTRKWMVESKHLLDSITIHNLSTTYKYKEVYSDIWTLQLRCQPKNRPRSATLPNTFTKTPSVHSIHSSIRNLMLYFQPCHLYVDGLLYPIKSPIQRFLIPVPMIPTSDPPQSIDDYDLSHWVKLSLKTHPVVNKDRQWTIIETFDTNLGQKYAIYFEDQPKFLYENNLIKGLFHLDWFGMILVLKLTSDPKTYPLTDVLTSKVEDINVMLEK